MLTDTNGWPPGTGAYVEMRVAPVGRASAEGAARYRIATPCCGCAVTVSLGRVRQLVRAGAGTAEPIWVQCGRTFNLRPSGRGCDADRGFDPVFAADGTLTAVRWRAPRQVG